MAIAMRVDSGLDGVVVADTVLSLVDGEAGRLVIRGRELADLVAHAGFEGTAALLWEDFLPEGGDREAVRAGLGAGRVAAWQGVPAFLEATRGLTTADAVRAGLAGITAVASPRAATRGEAPPGAASPRAATQGTALSGVTPRGVAPTAIAAPGHLPAHLRAAGAIPVFIAAHLRASAGRAPVAPEPSLTTAADLLRMLRGTPATDAEARAVDAYLATVADHGFNASTFTARVIASTRAGVAPAVTGAYCALQGPLHGGAPGPVLDMLDAAAASGDVAVWVDAALARGERLMGFGHRIYKVRDPRADVLREVAATLPHTAGRLALAREVEAAALAALRRYKPGQRLDTNVEFYTAVVLEAVGLPREAFTAVFAAGRVAGWIAHVCEQERTGRIIRPQSAYVGPVPQ